MTNYPTVFILTHGRPDRQLTFDALSKLGYTGDIYMVLDDTDTSIQQYIDNYGTSRLIVFNKNHYINSVATNVNNPKFACILYAKCAVEDIAHAMGLSTYILVDDDIFKFRLRYEENNSLRSISDFAISDVLLALSNYMLDADITMLGLACVNMSRSGVKMLESGQLLKNRLIYNVVLRNGNHPVNWESDYLEDVVTESLLNVRGDKLLCVPFLQYDSEPTHVIANNGCKDTGGMSATYAGDGFSLVFRGCVALPSHLSVSAKIHGSDTEYQVVKRKDFPKIISDKYRKENR